MSLRAAQSTAPPALSEGPQRDKSPSIGENSARRGFGLFLCEPTFFLGITGTKLAFFCRYRHAARKGAARREFPATDRCELPCAGARHGAECAIARPASILCACAEPVLAVHGRVVRCRTGIALCRAHPPAACARYRHLGCVQA